MSAKSEDDLIRMLADEVARNAYSDFMESIEIVTKYSESPIERVFGLAWQVLPIEGINFHSSQIPLDPDILLRHDWTGTVEWIGTIQPQVQIGNYRADFYLQAFDIDNRFLSAASCVSSNARITGQWLKLIIECDGHEFHESTAEQARRDKRRDRWFQTQGITVLRFTGSEIWADPLGCVDQIHDAFFAAWRRHYRPDHD